MGTFRGKLERGRGLSDLGRREAVHVMYGVSDEVIEQEPFLDTESDEGDEGLDAGLASDATRAKR